MLLGSITQCSWPQTCMSLQNLEMRPLTLNPGSWCALLCSATRLQLLSPMHWSKRRMQLLFTRFQLAACGSVRVCKVDMYECRPTMQAHCVCVAQQHHATQYGCHNPPEQMMHTKHEVCKLLSQPRKHHTATGQCWKAASTELGISLQLRTRMLAVNAESARDVYESQSLPTLEMRASTHSSGLWRELLSSAMQFQLPSLMH